MIPLLKSYKLEAYFGKVVTAATAKRPKPAPDGLLEILEHYECEPEEAIFIGDSVIDEEHASSCRVPLIAFKNTSLNAPYHVKTFMEIFHLPPFQTRRITGTGAVSKKPDHHCSARCGGWLSQSDAYRSCSSSTRLTPSMSSIIKSPISAAFISFGERPEVKR